MNPHFKKLYRLSHGTRTYDGHPTLDGNPPTVYWQGEASAGRFAGLIYSDIMAVIAAHVLTGDSALDVYSNLKRIYESNENL